MFKYLAENRLSPSNLSKHTAVKWWEIKPSCETRELCYLQHTGREPRLRETEQVPRRTSQLLGRWLLAQPVIPGTAGLGWQDTVPGQAGVLWLAMESPRAPGRALSEVCQRDLCNVAKPRTALGTLLGRRKALIPLIAVFQKCRPEMQGNNGLAKIMQRPSGHWWMWIWLSWSPSHHLALKITRAALLSWAMQITVELLLQPKFCQVLPWNQRFSPVLLQWGCAQLCSPWS